MSAENVALVRAIFEHSNARDFDAARECHADDVVMDLYGELAGIGAARVTGKQAMSEWFAGWFASFADDYRFEIHEARDLGDRVFIDATHHCRGRSSGAPMTQRSGWIYTVRDGKAVRIEAFPSPQEALAAAEPDQ